VSTSANGACLCGAITFAIAPPYRWFAHCHCSLCRKHHGSLFSTGLGVAREHLQWRSGTEDIVHYRATAAFERPFCRHCGSTVPGVTQDDGFLHVPAGLLADDPGARPRSHIFVASRSPLHTIADTLPQHAAYPDRIDAPPVARRAATELRGAITGSCVCDGIAFAATHTPRRVVNCYCSLCRRRTGAGFASTLLVPAGTFRWLRGEPRVRRYSLPQPRRYVADFCNDCGSPTPTVRDGQPFVMLPAGAIDSDLPPLPHVHLYVGSKAAWCAITDSWPQFAELPPAERFAEYFQ
jgi:hypothetical protein